MAIHQEGADLALAVKQYPGVDSSKHSSPSGGTPVWLDDMPCSDQYPFNAFVMQLCIKLGHHHCIQLWLGAIFSTKPLAKLWFALRQQSVYLYHNFSDRILFSKLCPVTGPIFFKFWNIDSGYQFYIFDIPNVNHVKQMMNYWNINNGNYFVFDIKQVFIHPSKQMYLVQ